MNTRNRRAPVPVHLHAPGTHAREKWLAHHDRQRNARLWRLSKGTIRWVRLPAHRDPKHPRGLLVGSSEAVPELLVYLGFERLAYDSPRFPADRVFIDASAYAIDPTPHYRFDCQGSDFNHRRMVKDGLKPFVRQARVWFACREDSSDDGFATPDIACKYRRKR